MIYILNYVTYCVGCTVLAVVAYLVLRSLHVCYLQKRLQAEGVHFSGSPFYSFFHDFPAFISTFDPKATKIGSQIDKK